MSHKKAQKAQKAQKEFDGSTPRAYVLYVRFVALCRGEHVWTN